MGAFESSKIIPVAGVDLGPVGEELMEHFRGRGFDVKGERTVTRGWHISLSQGGTFKAVLGMKTALNVEIEALAGGVSAKAGVGVFGLQALPSVITYFIAWPVLLTQIWGLVRQSQLDEEALTYIEESVQRHGSGAGPSGARFCTSCGGALSAEARFCSRCGSAVI